MPAPTWLSWSSGKDAAWALERLLDDRDVELRGLLSTVRSDTGAVPFQGTGRDLLQLQAAATGLDLVIVELEPGCDDATWKQTMAGVFARAVGEGVAQIAYGDIHLADVRRWREEVLAEHGLGAVFPLWGEDTPELASAMIDGGLRATVTCIDPSRLDRNLLGAEFDHGFLARLPAGIDPCGENGEFHTFVHAGPMLHDSFQIRLADPHEERGFLVSEPALSFPVDGTLDLHGVPPREVGPLVDDWIDACREAGITRLRIVHGKGIGVLREKVHARLRRRADVAGFRLGDEGGGGWGATLVELVEGSDEL